MKAIRKILACVRKADQDFNLINDDDKIIVGLSGGKDSIVLFYALTKYAKFSRCKFELQPVILDLGFPNFDASSLANFCKTLGYDLIVEDAKTVYPILLAQKDENKHIPCSICSRMKKAAINSVAKRLNFNKVTFAHHADDAIETLFMNEIYGSRIATFSPKMHLSKSNIDFIRPLIYAREDDISRCAEEENLCVLGSFCPADHHTSREDVKKTLNSIYEQYNGSKESFLAMLTNYENSDVWYNNFEYKIEGTQLSLKPVINKDETLIMINIRNEVFIEEEEIKIEDEYDGTDSKTNSFLIYLKNKPIGVIRYEQIKAHEFVFSRFAILKDYRKKGYGTSVLSYLENRLAREYNPIKITMHAQKQAINFYIQNGYKIKSEEFIEANIPHFIVNKTIKY